MIEEYQKNNPELRGKPIRMVEFGCGVPVYMKSILERFPEVSFVGIEPFKKSYDEAVAQYVGNDRVQIIHGDGTKVDFPDTSFDIVFSLSVLEHVKFLDAFIAESVRVAKPGALVLHRYDQGHALFPSSMKERFQVFLCNRFPSVVPVDKFACYVHEGVVRDMLAAKGAPVYKSTYHQMPDHKRLGKLLRDRPSADPYMEAIINWELAISPELENMKPLDRERLFPSIALWAKKT